MNILEKLFGSVARVKVLRLFLLSPEKVFSSKDASKILRISSRAVSTEIRFLNTIGFLKKKPKGFHLSQTFPFILAMRNLLITASPVSREKMLQFFQSRGKIKLVALGGIFSEDLTAVGAAPEDNSKLDLVVVGTLKKNQVESFIKTLESEIGKELNWTSLTQLEFEHRMSMHDKLLRDLFDFPHEFLINKLGVE